ncbi:hypothetical protein VitviT2T_019889 [Vitis vinifera]|uniref:Glutaredoxin domain-containing protein n=2 Tax=Vitis vinifera TaxID=29760 RepID=A0ABY9D3V4_VITVI|nr:uncharacterized protein At3g28850 [Vitis vinifera]WKA01618.1 hypothetical protein VitviT2T_019889 [Vitis vinifera]|eukprot:XP_002263752.1 PREDICTED: uncharacterized protein At3g28850 [Vitis vinifera]
MKGMKGKLLKKLKSIRPIGYLKEDRVLQVNASDGFLDGSSWNPSVGVQAQFVCKGTVQNGLDRTGGTEREPEVIDVMELMRDLEGEDMEFDDLMDDKENIGPPVRAKDPVGVKEKSENPVRSEPGFQRKDDGTWEATGNPGHTPLSEIDISSFRRPDLNSGSLFDPNLLAAFQQAVMDQIRINEEERKARMKEEDVEIDDEPPPKARRVEDDTNPLLGFEERCPPGGSDAVVLYTTSLRGIRKTFEDCTSIRFLLESFRVIFYERDVSMHLEFREELWRILDCKALPPRLFIKGRYIGGAEQVLGLHEQGRLRALFHGLPIDHSKGPCEGCAGIRFVMCYKCCGSRKIVSDDGNHGLSNNCPHCNENGLIICPICC